MADDKIPWPRKVIVLLRKHRSLNQNVFIPFLILVVDIMVRAALEIDLSDAGADMALLAESAFLITLIADMQQGDPFNNVVEEVFFVLLWLIAWLGCLMVVADTTHFAQFRSWVALAVGLTSLTIASFFLSELGEREGNYPHTPNPHARD